MNQRKKHNHTIEADAKGLAGFIKLCSKNSDLTFQTFSSHLCTGKIQQHHGKATAEIFEGVIKMPKNIYVVLYILVIIAVIVGLDLLFFRNRLWERLMVNIGIVLVFAAFYFRFLKNP